MRPKQGMQARIIAGSVVLALTLSPLAGAQDAVSPQSASSSANQSSPSPLPDSPGAIQSRSNHLQEVATMSPQENSSPISQPDQAQSPAANAATDPSPTASSPQSDSPQSSEPSPAPPSQSNQAGAQPPTQTQPQAPPKQAPREPVGTAAAESIQTTGVAASRPAGAAVAPAKQRRMRSILIKVGALVGVGVAVGTTMALSKGSPSKPPGAN
ncbi:MAG: hypothetical protein DMG80_00625 [Acidobacteria bacterium]|jgi:hypothetical protein|nr:MAG: hypothetical protein DMG80_00625 [Acidobacteriota bacterium]